MKNSIILFLLILLACSCGNKNNDNADDKNDSISDAIIEVPEQMTDDADTLSNGNYNLNGVLQHNKIAKAAYDQFKLSLKDTNNIKTNEQIESLIIQRDTLISILNETSVISNEFDKLESGKMMWDSIDVLENELNKIGISIITIEGMYGGLSQAPFINNLVNRVASEDLRLKFMLENAYGMSLGGEYPYLDLTWQAKALNYGGLLLTKYPQSKYTAQILNELKDCLVPYVDIHKVTSNSQPETFLALDFDTEAYPNMLDTSFHNQYITKYNHSIFAQSIKKIIDYPSQFDIEAKHFFIVQVPYEAKGLTQLDYLLKGIDIAHQLHLNNENYKDITLAYRYFDTKEKADEALAIISKQIPEAKIIDYDKEK